MKHTITKEQMVEYLKDAWVLMTGSSKEHKYLKANCFGTYQVTESYRIKCETTDLDEAILVYNEL